MSRTRAARDRALVLPADPDASARALRLRLASPTRRPRPPSSSPTASAAPGATGRSTSRSGWPACAPLDDWRGRTDAEGAELQATWLAVADAVAAAADLVRAKDSREPVVLIEGLERFVTAEDGPGARALLRALDEDLFR